MQPTAHLVFGSVSAALAASVLAVDLPYYAIAATAVLIAVLAAWLTLTVRGNRARKTGH